MNEAINKAIEKSKADGKTRYVYATYAKLVISFEPAPFNRGCYKISGQGNVFRLFNGDWQQLTPKMVLK